MLPPLLRKLNIREHLPDLIQGILHLEGERIVSVIAGNGAGKPEKPRSLVSGSISSESLSYFYGVVNSAFRYGVEALDVVEFDCGITKVCSLRKKLKTVEALGRGGTSFNEPIRYAHENGYDGLVILTDGYAPEPAIPQGFRCGILWVCENRDSFEAHEHWMKRSGRVCVMELQ